MTKQYQLPKGVQIVGEMRPGFEHVLTYDALELLAILHRKFDHTRLSLLQKRLERQQAIDRGDLPDFLPETREVREGDWQVGNIPDDLQFRRVEITGPVERKMMINALNSGAQVFMADCEDANSPTWDNIIEGQINLKDAVNGTISFASPDGKKYALKEKVAVLLVRPRGWHLPEKHIEIDGEKVSGGLVDFTLYFYHNARNLLKKGTGPYFYLPKLESYLEARLWNDVFNLAQDHLAIPRGTIKVTVLVETILAAYQMEEILYELRDHIVGMNAGRWDYIFSTIKRFRKLPGFLLPDRGQITMTVPFMRAYTELLVRTCHKRGAHAIGGMAAFIPSRRDEEVNRVALAKVAEDKKRESEDGFDGTWIAHPDLVETASREFVKVLGDRPHQKERMREDVQVGAADLRNFTIRGGKVTEGGVRQNINVALLYLESWLRGTGAAALYNLMEDAATAEISRAQLWQWVHTPEVKLDDGRPVNEALYREFLPEELKTIRGLVGEDYFAAGRFPEAVEILNELVLSEKFPEFLTLLAYKRLR